MVMASQTKSKLINNTKPNQTNTNLAKVKQTKLPQTKLKLTINTNQTKPTWPKPNKYCHSVLNQTQLITKLNQLYQDKTKVNGLNIQEK